MQHWQFTAPMAKLQLHQVVCILPRPCRLSQQPRVPPEPPAAKSSIYAKLLLVLEEGNAAKVRFQPTQVAEDK